MTTKEIDQLSLAELQEIKDKVQNEMQQQLIQKDAEALLKLCEPGLIDKKRYEIKVSDALFEVDEFFGSNTGLTIAEIELTTEDAKFPIPDWLGAEVTGDLKYYNSNLSKNPYQNWKI